MDPLANARVHALTASLLADLTPGVTDLLPGYGSLYVEYDASVVSEGRVREWLGRHSEASEESHSAGEVEIPVAYDGDDLQGVAQRTGMTTDEVIARHSAQPYRVYAMGFSPGFPFMGEVTSEIRMPRHPSPRKRVPAHSVAIAGAQTGIYPLASPGGWRLLGRALIRVYDPHREEPFLLRPGDSVRFTPAAGTPPDEPTPVALLPAEPEHPLLLVREPGLLDLVVDRGRFLVGRFGLSRGGPLDPRSAALANALLGNSADAPLLEMSLQGPVLEVLAPGVLAYAGRGLAPRLNGQEVSAFRSFAVGRGDVLSFAGSSSGSEGGGCRGYLALAGGIAANAFSGSSTTDLKSLVGARLSAGDRLAVAGGSAARPGFSFTPYWRPEGPCILRLLPGPQASKEATEALTAGPSRGRFRVVTADRLGVRLEGDHVPGGEILSEAVPIGAIQVPPGGSPILLLNDRGTLGGYVKPALLHPADLHKAGQLAPGSMVRFVWSSRR